MKLITLKIAILVIVSSAVPALAGAPFKVGNCTWCHGTSAEGYSTAPRLAGQRPRYLETQLLNFKTHARDNPFSRQFMWGATAALSPGEARGLADYLSTLLPKPANDGDPDIATTGKSIYELGMPDANIAACVVCHGPNAEGVREIPRLGGLAYSYLKRRLIQWGQGYHASARYPMPKVAKSLSPNDVEALASYLSFVR